MKRAATSLCVLLALRAASPEGLRGARAEGGARRWLGEWAVAPWSALDAVARLAAEVRVVPEDGLERLVRGVALGRREALVDWRGLHQAQLGLLVR